MSACAEVHIQPISHRLGSNWDYRDLSGFFFYGVFIGVFQTRLTLLLFTAFMETPFVMLNIPVLSFVL